MHFDTDIGTSGLALLAVALLLALGFEFVNGFHDTANAVATVIYTKTLRPMVAVAWSGFFNFLGVAVGGLAVAMSVMKLLPTVALEGGGLAMVLSLLTAAILWNLGTWYLGLPASSSHTLIGAIVGVTIASAWTAHQSVVHTLPWHRIGEVGLALLISPALGFVGTLGLVLLARLLLKEGTLHQPAHIAKPPPTWIRGLLVTTCGGVSFAHGSNDGQKGIGLVMVILIGLLPADYAINRAAHHQVEAATHIEQTIEHASPSPALDKARSDLGKVKEIFAKPIEPKDRLAARNAVLEADASVAALDVDSKKDRAELRQTTDYAPWYVLALVAMTLGLGTMIGWKRIVTTVGERIGKTHLSYAQGASAELVAMATIGLSAGLGMPVSTTHVLSSGVAGSMVANHAGLQKETVRNIALAWILTLPVSMVLAGLLYLGFHAVLHR